MKLLALKVQGKALEAIDLEKENKVWKRIADGLPSGQLSFILQACSDTLPTQVNLQRWKFQLQAKCKLCDSGNATIHHILNGCPEALSGGRYSWRHDCVLKYLANSLKRAISDMVFADLDNLRASESPPATILYDVVVTTARPDIIVLSRDGKIRIAELTICTKRKGIKATYTTIEIGALGHYAGDLVSLLSTSFPELNKKQWRHILDEAAKISIDCSQTIYLGRNLPHWSL